MIIKKLRSVAKLPLTKNPALRRSLDRIMKSYKAPSPQLINPNINDFIPTFIFNVVVISNNPCSIFKLSDTKEFPEDTFSDQLIQIEGKESDYFPANNVYYLNNDVIRGGNNYYVNIDNRDWVRISDEGIKLEEGICTPEDIRNSNNPAPGEEPRNEEEVTPENNRGVIPGGGNPDLPRDGNEKENNNNDEPIINNRFRV
jgi:hypothetical protein